MQLYQISLSMFFSWIWKNMSKQQINEKYAH